MNAPKSCAWTAGSLSPPNLLIEDLNGVLSTMSRELKELEQVRL
jgi:hypothetical protein